MKRKLLLLSVMVICIAIAAAGTLAFFNGDATAHNVITTGKVGITVNEYSKYDPDKRVKYENNQTGIMPGTTVNKIVVVSGEDGTADAWVRVKFTKSIQLANGTAAPAAGLGLIKLNTGDGWIDGQDGWYYYNKAVKAGEEAAPALKSVEFDTKMDNTYQGATATVDVLAQAVQCANNGTSAQTASGWPADDPGTNPDKTGADGTKTG